MTEIEHFMPLLMQQEEEGVLAPLLSHGRVHFLWIKHSNLYCIRPALVGSAESPRARSGEPSPERAGCVPYTGLNSGCAWGRG